MLLVFFFSVAAVSGSWVSPDKCTDCTVRIGSNSCDLPVPCVHTHYPTVVPMVYFGPREICEVVGDHARCHMDYSQPRWRHDISISYPKNYTREQAVAFCKKAVRRDQHEIRQTPEQCDDDPTLPMKPGSDLFGQRLVGTPADDETEQEEIDHADDL